MTKNMLGDPKKTFSVKSRQTTEEKLLADNQELLAQLEGSELTIKQLTETIQSLTSDQLELTKEIEKLLRINEDLEHFVYAVSHDLLGPFGNIEASLSGIQRQSRESDFKLYLQVIDSSIKKFSEVIKNLVTIATLENNMDKQEMVDLNEMITQIKMTIEHLEPSGAEIISDLAVEKIRFSKMNLYSILYNLISNGIKFKGSEMPVVHILTQKAGDQTLLIVRDNGKGMPVAAMDKVFSMYGRLYNEIKSNGIGLYLAKKLVNASGGRIQVSSEEGKGSEIIISFQNLPR